MKKISSIKLVILLLGGLVTALTISQCKKTGDVISNLDRSFTGVPDSTVFAPYNDTTIIAVKDVNPDVNDRIIARGVRSIIKEYCGTSNCHGGAINPKIFTYNDIMKYVVPGSPEGSKLWEYINTNDFNKAMPPVASNAELSRTDKTILYNWIRNGAKENPNLADFRPAAIRLLVDGCSSANCHNQATACGAWARKGLLGPLTTADTTQYIYTNPSSGSVTNYCQLSNPTKLAQVWTAYKDSVKRFYSDTLANASFRPYKTFGLPVSAISTRGPLGNYDDILMDILYPKSVRSNSSVVFTNANGNRFYVRGNPLNATSSMVSRIDSTLLLANPFTNVFATAHQGDMAYGDGGLKPGEIALIKAWYFADPNIPNVWKYGNNNVGIFKYRKTGNIDRKSVV